MDIWGNTRGFLVDKTSFPLQETTALVDIWGYNREIHVDFSSISRDFCAWVWFSPYFIKPTTALFRFYPINVSSCKCYYSCSVQYHPFVSYQFLGCIILHPRGLILYYHDIMLSIPISIYTEYVYNLPFRV